MCGIAGFAGQTPGREQELVEAMLAKLVHRGPDAGASRTGAGWAVGARRLAIIDLATGDQPVTDESGAVVAVCNGEIYNYRELREELLARGHTLRSVGDTEVLVHLWEDYGPEMLERLRGMFALALLDTGRQSLFLARDRVGKKPIYWTPSGGGVVFASELKALREALPARPALEPGAVASFLGFGFVPEGQCILAGVRKLPPAHWLQLDLHTGDTRVGRYWRLELEPDARVGFQEAQAELIHALRESVRLRLRSDVPLGVFLSGGLDSGAVASLAAREAPGLRAITVSFAGGEDETPLARVTAARAGVQLTTIEVRPEEGLGLLPTMAEVFDEPLADPSCIPTYLVAREAKHLVTVVLTGDGGDEGLAGYRRFLAARLVGVPGARLWGPPAARLMPGIPAGWRERLAAGLRSGSDPYLSWGPVKFLPSEVASLLDADAGQGGALELRGKAPGGRGPFAGANDPINRMRAQEIGFFLAGDLLVKMDRATMASSLEARSPFLDHKLLERVATFPPSLLVRGWRTKAVLRAATAGLLPEEVRRAPKRGFEVPLSSWLSGPWAAEVRAVLEDPAAAVRALIPPQRLAPWREWAQRRDRERAARAVYTLLTLEHWLRRWG
jgi:asparagine synthase (glutamine-hydrolysing)